MIGIGKGMFLVNPYIYGGAAFTNDYSLLFDGVDEYVDCGNVSEFQNVSSFSNSFWVKLNDTSGHQLVGRDQEYFAYADPTTGFWRVRINAGGTQAQNDYNDTISTGSWIHVCVVYDGTLTGDANRLKLYINGTSLTRTGGVSGIPATTNNTAKNYNIGSNASGSSFFSNAYIDEVSVFDYSLTASNVTDIYNSGTPTDLDNTSGVTAPVHWWRMGDGSDTITTINDVGTASSNNGTPQNMESGDIVNDTP